MEAEAQQGCSGRGAAAATRRSAGPTVARRPARARVRGVGRGPSFIEEMLGSEPIWQSLATWHRTRHSNMCSSESRCHKTDKQWSSGRIVPCHGTDPGSIPGCLIEHLEPTRPMSDLFWAPLHQTHLAYRLPKVRARWHAPAGLHAAGGGGGGGTVEHTCLTTSSSRSAAAAGAPVLNCTLERDTILWV